MLSLILFNKLSIVLWTTLALVNSTKRSSRLPTENFNILASSRGKEVYFSFSSVNSFSVSFLPFISLITFSASLLISSIRLSCWLPLTNTFIFCQKLRCLISCSNFSFSTLKDLCLSFSSSISCKFLASFSFTTIKTPSIIISDCFIAFTGDFSVLSSSKGAFSSSAKALKLL